MTTASPLPAAAPPRVGASDGEHPSGRSAAEAWRAARLPIAVAVLIAVAVAVIALVSRQPEGTLDPRGVDPAGSHALAVLLADRGVQVRRTEGVTAAVRAATVADTVFVPFPDLLPATALDALARRPHGPLVVLVDPASGLLRKVFPHVAVSGRADVRVRLPHCALPAALTAGDAEIGGATYVGTGTACYDGALFAVRGLGVRSAVLLGGAAALTNARLDHRGNAALALGLLGGKRRLYWVMPGAGAVPPGDRGTLVELLPPWVLPAAAQLAVAGLLMMLWRGRRLGPVVTEPLPVIVRAAETVEGRARLYRRGRARDRAADTLRTAARDRLGDLLGLGADPPPGTVVAAVTARTRGPVERVRDVLYGPAPADDGALIQLAEQLDGLDAEVRATFEHPRTAAAQEGLAR